MAVEYAEWRPFVYFVRCCTHSNDYWMTRFVFLFCDFLLQSAQNYSHFQIALEVSLKYACQMSQTQQCSTCVIGNCFRQLQKRHENRKMQSQHSSTVDEYTCAVDKCHVWAEIEKGFPAALSKPCDRENSIKCKYFNKIPILNSFLHRKVWTRECHLCILVYTQTK